MLKEGKKKDKVRIWVDGCFDGMHYGHSNALRQAKLMGDYLVVGVHSDTAIEENKGPTVSKNEERYAAVEACKWVDEVVKDAPYLTQVEWLDKYDCAFCVHGDDVTTTADGSDCYSIVKAAGRYKECKRTEGVSTTDLIKRMLERKENPKGTKAVVDEEYTKEKLLEFSNNTKPKHGDNIVYVQGSFDMFHSGHAEFLKAAKSLGDYLFVGILNDDAVLVQDGHYPIMDMNERALSALACRFTDDIILNCASIPSDEFLSKIGVHIVCNGYDRFHKDYQAQIKNFKLKYLANQSSNISCDKIIERIVADHEKYAARNRNKEAKAKEEGNARNTIAK